MEDCNVHSLICDVAVLAEGSVLMVKYEDLAKYDGEAGWFLPDDVLRELEHPTRAAARILKEQLGLEVDDEPRLGLIESLRGNNALPPRAEVAHNGWSLNVLKNMVGGPVR